MAHKNHSSRKRKEHYATQHDKPTDQQPKPPAVRIRGGLVSFGEPRLVAEIHTAARRARPAIYEPRALARANIFGCVVAIGHSVLEMEEIGLCSLQSNASESRESDPLRHGRSEGPRSARRSAVGFLATY